MVNVMRLLVAGGLFPLVCFCAELKDVKSVYLYPMMGGLDQHLAHRLTLSHTFRVVSDPKLADAVFTDQLGAQLEYRISHIKRDPPPAPATPPPAATAPATPPANSFGMSAETEPRTSSFSRGRGTVFLVDAKSRQVVWSDYHRPAGSSPQELERTAKAMTGNLSKTLNPSTVSPK